MLNSDNTLSLEGERKGAGVGGEKEERENWREGRGTEWRGKGEGRGGDRREGKERERKEKKRKEKRNECDH